MRVLVARRIDVSPKEDLIGSGGFGASLCMAKLLQWHVAAGGRLPEGRVWMDVYDVGWALGSHIVWGAPVFLPSC